MSEGNLNISLNQHEYFVVRLYFGKHLGFNMSEYLYIKLPFYSVRGSYYQQKRLAMLQGHLMQ